MALCTIEDMMVLNSYHKPSHFGFVRKEHKPTPQKAKTKYIQDRLSVRSAGDASKIFGCIHCKKGADYLISVRGNFVCGVFVDDLAQTKRKWTTLTHLLSLILVEDVKPLVLGYFCKVWMYEQASCVV